MTTTQKLTGGIVSHDVARPHWLDALADAVIDLMTPLGVIGPLGFCWWEPQGTATEWVVAVYPTPNELRGGQHDGCLTVSGFQLDVLKLISFFSSVAEVAWRSPVRCGEDFDGPELFVRGLFLGKTIRLRVFLFPPHDEPAGCIIDAATGQAREKKG